MNLTYVKTDNKNINTAYYTAISDIIANIKPFKGGLWKKDVPVMIAGIGYNTPWTRDASINVMNAGGLLFPEIAENTLISVLKKVDGSVYIDGEYWDKIIWVLGAWHLYLVTANTEFLKTAYIAAQNTIKFMEDTEFDKTLNLFRGAACYGDGIAAYPDDYVSPSNSSSIMSFIYECPEKIEKYGMGLPMYALSTNCLYYQAYITADLMAEELGLIKEYEQKASRMKEAINTHFWNEEKGIYNYLVDKFGGCDSSEGLGQAFAILFGIADEEKRNSIFFNQPITPNGIACVFPSFDRYKRIDKSHYGRHSGTVWSHIQSFWADAAEKYGKHEIFLKEFDMLTEASVRDGLFAEIYHPETGEIYGGVQEKGDAGIVAWKSELKQTWSATGYLHMIFHNIAGICFQKDGLSFLPYLPDEIGQIEITNLQIRDNIFTIKINGKGSKIKQFMVDSEVCNGNFVPYSGKSHKNIEIIVG